MALHKLSHQHFVTELLALKHDRTDANFEKILERIVSFLTRWLAFHILDTDKRMAQIALQSAKASPWKPPNAAPKISPTRNRF